MMTTYAVVVVVLVYAVGIAKADMISSTKANDPLVRAARPELVIIVLSSPSTAGLLGCATFRTPDDSRAC
jgi:hypothetical protein